MRSSLVRLALAGLVTLVFSANPELAVAQGSGSLSGKVTASEGGFPLGAARVQALSGARVVGAAVTGDDGAYRMDVPAGTYDMLVLRIGYTPMRRNAVQISGATTFDAALAPGITRLDAVVATASRREEKAIDAPAQVQVVTDTEVEERATVTLAGHVQGKAGVDVSQGGVAQSNIVGRGFNNAFSGSMLMLQDYRFAGVPSLRVNIPLLFTGTNEDIERVEVLLGPASALFGPNAANGVLHVITKSPFSSRGNTVTIDGGERSMLRTAVRSSYVLNDKLGIKLSGEMMRADDFEYLDPGEPTNITRGGASVPNVRDFTVERLSGEARVDIRPKNGLELITSVGTTEIGNGIELTAANGSAQVRNWRYTTLQQRMRWNRLFAQVFMNISYSGNADSTDLDGTFLLRSGQPIVDQSRVTSFQAQHGWDIHPKVSVDYGADYIKTNPRTGNTINGRNEDVDDMTEMGAYAQSTIRLHPKLDLLGAFRVDRHELIDGAFTSPRAALTFKPSATQSARVTYNRAFNTPQNFSFFLDLIQARNPSGLPFNIRALGNPPKKGWKFDRSCATGAGGLCMRSAFVPTSNNGGAMIPAQAGLGLPGLVFGQRNALITGIQAQLQAGGMSAAQANAAATGIVNELQAQNAGLPNIVTQVRYLTATSTLDPTLLTDIEPLKASYNTTYEVGYKGVLRKARFDVAFWSQERGDVGTPAGLATPNVFMQSASLTAHMTPRISGVLQAGGMSAAQANAVAAQVSAGLSTQLSPAPMGTITFNDPTLAPTADVLATYQTIYKTVTLWGSDVAADYLINDELTATATYGYASKTVFDEVMDSRLAPMTSNAPAHKGSLTLKYAQTRGWGGEIRGRYSDAYTVNSGVYSTYGTFLSPNAGGQPYSYAPVPAGTLVDLGVNRRFLIAQRDALVALTVTNLLNREQATFAGVPAVGRLSVLRLQYSF